MKRWIAVLTAGLILTSSFLTETRAQTRKEERKAAREYRKMMKQEAGTYNNSNRMAKENFRQRKKMYRESQKTNRRSREVNSLGNVYKGL